MTKISDVDFLTVDANGCPISGATVATSDGVKSSTTDASGHATLALAIDEPAALTVYAPKYVPERVTFSRGVSTGSYDNSLVSITMDGSEPSLVRVTLGRLGVAPVAKLDGLTISALATHHGSAAAVLIDDAPQGGGYAYSLQSYSAVPIELAGAVLLPDPAPAKDARGWRRFNATPSAKVDIAQRGRFFWLLYPQDNSDQQFLVAVWSPNISSETPVDILNMVVFLSPSTSAFPSRTFGVVFDNSSTPIAYQPYMWLGTRYLLEEYMFAYALAAHENPSVVVMPIFPQGDWGPFVEGSGMLRLLREVSVFLHRECRTSSLGVTQTGYDPAYRLAGGSLRGPGVGIRAADFGEVPTVGRLAVSFFSSGSAPARLLMNTGNWALNRDRFSEQYWGAESPAGGRDAKLAWTSSWCELWDMDGFHAGDPGGWDDFVRLLETWHAQGTDRRFRLCHSAGREPPDPRSNRAPLWTKLMQSKPTVAPAFLGPGLPWEVDGDRWSAVAFPDDWVIDGSATSYPRLPGPAKQQTQDDAAHHNTAKVAFSQAAALTTVGIRRVPPGP